MPDYYVGVDYAMDSPGICVFDNSDLQPWSIENCTLHYGTHTLCRVVPSKMIRPYLLEDFKSSPRWDNLSAWALSCIPDSAVVWLEDYSYNSQGVNYDIGENTGVLKDRLWKRGIPRHAANITIVKKLACGMGNAVKEDMEEAFIKETGLNLQAWFGVEKNKDKSPVYDLIDAYYICKLAFIADVLKKDSRI